MVFNFIFSLLVLVSKYNLDSIELHFYELKLGFTEVTIMFLNEYSKTMFCAKTKGPEARGRNAHLSIQLLLNRKLSISCHDNQ